MNPISTAADWRPTATIPRLRQRAALLRSVREFFAERDILEVETPLLVAAPVSDINIHSARVQLAGGPGCSLALHTSPEYAMKRLLAAGSGDIWQLCKVVRGEESGRLHNVEFTLLEWYRLGFDSRALIEETAALVNRVLEAAGGAARPLRTMRYRDAFAAATALDPLECARAPLESRAQQLGLAPHSIATLDRDALLDAIMGLQIGPTLGQGCLTAITHYPASQAALARLDPLDPRVAERFEIYADGIELANGFHELADAAEQRMRFERDNAERARRGLPGAALDERLLGALQHGLPDCSGVALGFDRLAMLACGASSIAEVISFTTEHA